jgi:hypothetical protein
LVSPGLLASQRIESKRSSSLCLSIRLVKFSTSHPHSRYFIPSMPAESVQTWDRDVSTTLLLDVPQRFLSNTINRHRQSRKLCNDVLVLTVHRVPATDVPARQAQYQRLHGRRLDMKLVVAFRTTVLTVPASVLSVGSCRLRRSAKCRVWEQGV